MKQETANSRFILYERVGDSHRMKETIAMLNNCEKVVTMGLPGISKSTEINTDAVLLRDTYRPIILV
jgi:hypothetical protein